MSEGIFLWNALNPRVQAEKAGSSIPLLETDLTWENEYRINFESNLAGYKEEFF
jgi:hypothetical protein